MKKLLYIAIILVVGMLLTGCKSKEEKKVYGLYDKYESNGLAFKISDIKENNGTYTITSVLNNTTDSQKNIKWYELNVTLENGKKNTIMIYFGNIIEPHQTLQTTTSVDFDANLIKSIDYNIN